MIDLNNTESNCILDLSDPIVHSRSELSAFFEGARKNNPVFYTQTNTGDGAGFWSVTRMGDCKEVLSNHQDYTSEDGNMLSMLGRRDPGGKRLLALTDPPNHEALRNPISKVLNRDAIGRHSIEIKNLYKRFCEPLAQGETVDLSEKTSFFSAGVACLIFGLPLSDIGMLARLSSMCIAPEDNDYSVDTNPVKTMRKAHRELFDYFSHMLKSVNKSDDSNLLSCMLNIKIDGQPLPESTIISNCFGLLLGASVTTPYAPVSTIFKIANTSAYEKWSKNLGGDNRLAIEEALRWSSPASHFMRYAKKNLILSGKEIKKGEAVVAWISSANMDESVFLNPEKFDIERKPNKHIAFGFGPHLCIGHILARHSLDIFLNSFVHDFYSIEINFDKTEKLSSNLIRGYKRMPMSAKYRF